MDARDEVLDRLRIYASSADPRRRQAGFIHPARVAAAQALAAEGRIRCWVETWPRGGEVLVCELAAPSPLPRPFDGGRVA